MLNTRLHLSPPHMSGLEQAFVQEVFASNYIAPLGPQVDAFEAEFAAAVGAPHALALSSGTAALHLALILAGVGAGDEVLVSTLTFSASANPVAYLGGRPTFIDSERVLSASVHAVKLRLSYSRSSTSARRMTHGSEAAYRTANHQPGTGPGALCKVAQQP